VVSQSQAQGLIGRQVEAMIGRSLRARFHTIWWEEPGELPTTPCIYVPNHHAWHDGYVMYTALTRLHAQRDRGRFYDWIQEYDAFPLFGRIGGLPFPPNDAAKRAITIRKTIRMMNEESASLLLFAEQHMHRPPELREFGKALEMISRQVPTASVVPVAIHYELCRHERPEAYVRFGKPVEVGPDLSRRTRNAVRSELDFLRAVIEFQPDRLSPLLKGTRDVNERLDVRRFRRD
jgi:1-acyl-sn-glycerol-3-phosphate acyltransferase